MTTIIANSKRSGIQYISMVQVPFEAEYPISFRQSDAQKLGQLLKNHTSVVLIGMKRVGISNFLRFFLNHKDITAEYIDPQNNYLFITVDLQDLVEKEMYPFWTLVLKRIADTCENSALPGEVKKYVETLFLESIQSQDLFFTIDCVRRSLVKIVETNMLPILFLLRFDRIKDVVTPQFFDNLQGLQDATHDKLTYVFTSFRSLDKLSPQVFTRASLSVFAQSVYIKPAKINDTKKIFETYTSRYKITLSSATEQGLFELVDGYIQYLLLALIILHEKNVNPQSKDELFDILIKDERMSLQSEELWESLDSTEQMVLLKISKGQEVVEEEREKARYLWDTGFVLEQNSSPREAGKLQVFSQLFSYYIKQKDKTPQIHTKEFTKKENALFNLLKENVNEICEREKIVESVWPEAQAFGVSDWAIDRLVARVRGKLKLQQALFEIQTVKTRGYKLISKDS